MRYPDKINFESTTGCSAKCKFCTRYRMTREHGEMSDELMRKIIKEGKEMGVKNYSPFLMGDPFVFSRIWEWLDYMEKEGVEVSLYTNGTHIDIDRLLKHKNIRYLNFSINAATPGTHKTIMRGPVFEEVKRKYDYAREKAYFPVRASFVITQDNVNEIDEFKKLFPSHEVTGFSNWTGDVSDPLERRGERIPCWVLFHQMTILYDGTVVPCCMDYDGKQVMGDADLQHLKDIWENSEWMRERHRNYDFGTFVCRKCNYNVKEKRHEGPNGNISDSEQGS